MARVPPAAKVFLCSSTVASVSICTTVYVYCSDPTLTLRANSRPFSYRRQHASGSCDHSCGRWWWTGCSVWCRIAISTWWAQRERTVTVLHLGRGEDDIAKALKQLQLSSAQLERSSALLQQEMSKLQKDMREIRRK